MTELRKAAEQALRYLDKVSDWDTTYPIGKAKEALRQALAQTEQEPVAWRNTETGEFCTGGFLLKDLAKWTPLYTAPPKKEWVGLTDDERKQIVSYIRDPIDWVPAVEAKLKEKNV